MPEVPAVLFRIADCESGQRQYNDDGSVVRHKNANGSFDAGFFQINSSHFKEARAMGFDPMTPEGNIAYGLYLYHQSGTQPWNSSKSCWGGGSV